MRILQPRFRQRGFYLPWVGGAAPAGDPDISFVVNLTHANSNSLNAFDTVIGPSFANAGPGASLDTSVKALGAASILIPGVCIVSLNPGTTYHVGTNDYCYDLFFYATTLSTQVLLDCRPASTAGAWPVVVIASGAVLVDVNGSTLYSGGSLSTGQWYFLRHCRVGTTAYLHLGAQGSPTASLIASATDANNYADSATVWLGVSAFSSFPLSSGNIDEFRFTNGSGRGGGSTVAIPTSEFVDF